MDNTVLSTGGGGDTIRTLDKTGTGAPKTEVVALDLGGGDGRSETIASFPLPVKLDDVPVNDDGTPFISLSSSSMDAIEMLFRQTIAAASAPYLQTAVEIAAKVTPSNPIYPELNVMRYGALGDGVNDDSGAFSTAGLVASINGGTIVVPKPAVTFLLLNPVNFTNFAISGARSIQPGFRVLGVGALFDTSGATPDTGVAHITIKHTGIGFDCSGTRSIYFENLSITTDFVTFPQVCFFHARNALGASQIYRFNNVTVTGYYSKCIRYNYGSEQDDEIGCAFYIASVASVNTAVEIITSSNILGLTSTFGTIATGSISGITQAASAVITLSTVSSVNPFASWPNSIAITGVLGMTQINGLQAAITAVGGSSGAWTVTVAINSSAFSAYTSGGTLSGVASNRAHRFYGGEYSNANTDTTATDVFRLEGVNNCDFRDSFFYCKGRSFIYVDPTFVTSNYISLLGIEGENASPLPTYGILFANAPATQTPTAWGISDCYIPSTTRAIFGGTNVVFDSFYLSNITEASSLGLQCGTLQNSTCDGVNVLNLTTCTKNFLIGAIANFTLGTTTNTAIINRTLGEGRFNQLTGITGGAVQLRSTTASTLLVDSTAAAGPVVSCTASGTTEVQVGTGLAVLGTGSNQDACLAGRGSLFLATNFATFLQGTTAKDIIARGIAICKFKSGNTDRNTTTTASADPDLAYAIPVTGTYRIEVLASIVGITTGTQGWKGGIDYTGTVTQGPGGARGFANAAAVAASSAQVGTAATTTTVALATITTTANTDYVIFEAILVAGTTGTVSLNWAQNSSSANNTRVATGSYMTVTQLS